MQKGEYSDMANYNKGKDTQKNILAASSRLFYKQGYNETTTRQIAEEAGINLGLIKYYFDSKADIAYHIYLKIRNIYDEAFSAQGYSDIELFLLSSAAELKLCFTNRHFLIFYRDIYRESKLVETLHSHVTESLNKNSKKSESYKILASACLTSIKPSLVNQYISAGDEHFSNETYIRFYLEQQTYFNDIRKSASVCDYIMQELDKYELDLNEGFQPVIRKLR